MAQKSSNIPSGSLTVGNDDFSLSFSAGDGGGVLLHTQYGALPFTAREYSYYDSLFRTLDVPNRGYLPIDLSPLFGCSVRESPHSNNTSKLRSPPSVQHPKNIVHTNVTSSGSGLSPTLEGDAKAGEGLWTAGTGMTSGEEAIDLVAFSTSSQEVTSSSPEGFTAPMTKTSSKKAKKLAKSTASVSTNSFSNESSKDSQSSTPSVGESTTMDLLQLSSSQNTEENTKPPLLLDLNDTIPSVKRNEIITEDALPSPAEWRRAESAEDLFTELTNGGIDAEATAATTTAALALASLANEEDLSLRYEDRPIARLVGDHRLLALLLRSNLSLHSLGAILRLSTARDGDHVLAAVEDDFEVALREGHASNNGDHYVGETEFGVGGGFRRILYPNNFLIACKLVACCQHHRQLLETSRMSHSSAASSPSVVAHGEDKNLLPVDFLPTERVLARLHLATVAEGGYGTMPTADFALGRASTKFLAGEFRTIWNARIVGWAHYHRDELLSAHTKFRIQSTTEWRFYPSVMGGTRRESVPVADVNADTADAIHRDLNFLCSASFLALSPLLSDFQNMSPPPSISPVIVLAESVNEVERRYSDFVTLSEILTSYYHGHCLPPLPPKDWKQRWKQFSTTTNSAMDEAAHRRALAFRWFFADLSSHPVFAQTAEVAAFFSTTSTGLRNFFSIYGSAFSGSSLLPPTTVGYQSRKTGTISGEKTITASAAAAAHHESSNSGGMLSTALDLTSTAFHTATIAASTAAAAAVNSTSGFATEAAVRLLASGANEAAKRMTSSRAGRFVSTLWEAASEKIATVITATPSLHLPRNDEIYQFAKTSTYLHTLVKISRAIETIEKLTFSSESGEFWGEFSQVLKSFAELEDHYTEVQLRVVSDVMKQLCESRIETYNEWVAADLLTPLQHFARYEPVFAACLEARREACTTVQVCYRAEQLARRKLEDLLIVFGKRVPGNTSRRKSLRTDSTSVSSSNDASKNKHIDSGTFINCDEEFTPVQLDESSCGQESVCLSSDDELEIVEDTELAEILATIPADYAAPSTSLAASAATAAAALFGAARGHNSVLTMDEDSQAEEIRRVEVEHNDSIAAYTAAVREERSLTAAITQEVRRFDRLQKHQISAVLANFATIQAAVASEDLKYWQNALLSLNSLEPPTL